MIFILFSMFSNISTMKRYSFYNLKVLFKKKNQCLLWLVVLSSCHLRSQPSFLVCLEGILALSLCRGS